MKGQIVNNKIKIERLNKRWELLNLSREQKLSRLEFYLKESKRKLKEKE